MAQMSQLHTKTWEKENADKVLKVQGFLENYRFYKSKEITWFNNFQVLSTIKKRFNKSDKKNATIAPPPEKEEEKYKIKKKCIEKEHKNQSKKEKRKKMQ